MRLLDRFKRDRSEVSYFWRTPPLRTRDVAVLHDYGIRCSAERNGPAMMQTGWALWSITGSLHERQAYDLLSGGFELWPARPTHDASQATAFLEDLFGRLATNDPPVPHDLWAAPPRPSPLADSTDPTTTKGPTLCLDTTHAARIAIRARSVAVTAPSRSAVMTAPSRGPNG